jgi:predicted nucleic acid-binding protein
LAGFLVDTNVLVYAYDQTDGSKRSVASEVLKIVGGNGTGALSTQVLSEFFVTVTRKIPTPLSHTEASEKINRYIESWVVYYITTLIVSEAIRGVLAHQLSYYDSLIWATARLNQVGNVVTEDGQHGRVVEGVRYLDPFHEAFDIAALEPQP